MKLSKIPLIVGVFALLLCAGQVLAANQVATVQTAGTNIKYKAGALSNCSDASGWTEGSDLAAALAAAGASSTLNICNGTYSGAMIDASDGIDATHNSQSIVGESRSGVILDGTGINDSIISVDSMTGFSISTLTLKNSYTDKYAITVTSVSATISNLDILDCSRGIYFSSAGAAGVVSNVYFSRILGSDWNISFGSTTETVFNNCVFENLRGRLMMGVNSTSVIFNNCIFTGSRQELFYNAVTRTGFTYTFNNCIFAGNALDDVDISLFITNSQGTWNFNNCIVSPVIFVDGSSGIFSGSPTINNANNSSFYYPLWKQPSRSGRVFFFIDDTANSANWLTLAALANSYGIKACFALYRANADALDFAAIASAISSGNEVGSHGWSGVTNHTTNVFTAAKIGSSVVIAVTRTDAEDSATWTGTLTLDAEAPIDLASTSYDTVDEVIAYLQSKGVTIGTAANQIAYNSTDFKPKSLALAAGTYNVNSVQTILFHENSLYVTEMKDSKAWIEAQIQTYIPGWTCKSFVYSGGYSTANGQAYALGNAGYSQARAVGLSPPDTSGIAPIGLEKLNMAAVRSHSASLSLGATDAAIKNNLYNLLTGLEQIGGVAGIHDHAFSGFTLANWTSLLSAAASYGGGITFDTMSGVLDWVRANDDHLTGTISYKCSTETDSCFSRISNYNLRAGSPAIDAGAPVAGLHTSGSNLITGGDFYGITKLYGRGIDIGASERKKFIEDDLTGDWMPKFYRVP